MNGTSMKGLSGAVLTAFAATGHCAKADGPWLFGDWGGERTRLQRQGIDFQFGYVSETAYNAEGGTGQGTRYTDQWTFGSTLDLQRLLSDPDAKLQVSITDRNGRNLSSDENLGTLQQVQEVYGRGESWRITDFWYQQSYFNQRVDVKLGRLPVGEDFASFSCDFQNLSFCGAPAGNIVGSYWYNWPVSQWAARVKVNGPHDTYFQVGAYQANSNYLTERYAFNLDNPPGTTGALIPMEFGWTPTLWGMPGRYKIGGWYNTSKTANVGINDMPETRRSRSYGGYLLAQQQVLPFAPGADPKRGLSVFFNATQADRNTATVDSQYAVGLVATGIFRSRPKDDVGLAAARTHVNSRVAASEVLDESGGFEPEAVQHSEYATELYYGWHVLPGAVVRPNLQFIHEPGGIAEKSDVVVVGLKVGASF
jgi:porin